MSTPSPHHSVPSSSSPAAPALAGRRRRMAHPPIDIDKTISDARAAVKSAQKAMADARALARNERRKRARLIKKAAQLSPRDLDRIAILKKCGVWDPVSQTRRSGSPQDASPRADADRRSSTASAAGSTDTASEERPPPPATDDHPMPDS